VSLNEQRPPSAKVPIGDRRQQVAEAGLELEEEGGRGRVRGEEGELGGECEGGAGGGGE
jgi:hypothetical protein